LGAPTIWGRLQILEVLGGVRTPSDPLDPLVQPKPNSPNPDPNPIPIHIPNPIPNPKHTVTLKLTVNIR